MKKRYILGTKPEKVMPKTYLFVPHIYRYSLRRNRAETDIRVSTESVFDLNDFFAVLLSALGANSVVEIVSAAVGALFQSGLGEFPHAGTSGILSCFRCFSLRYCHFIAPPNFLLQPYTVLFFFEKVRQTGKSGINFFSIAFAGIGI